MLAILALAGLALSGLLEDLNDIFQSEGLMGIGLELQCQSGQTATFYRGYQVYQRSKLTNQLSAYRIASISKTFTAASVLLLVQKGALTLESSVQQILGFNVRNPFYKQSKITVSQLLSHTSTIVDGPLYDNFLTDVYSSKDGGQLPELKQYLQQGGRYYSENNFLRKKPSQYFQYCNSCFIVLGTIVQKLSGQRFDKFVKINILQPLGLTASFNIEDVQPARIAALYRYNNSQWVPQRDYYPSGLPPAFNFTGYRLGTGSAAIFSPQGGLHISVKQLITFITNYNNRSQAFPLTQSSIDLQKKVYYVANASNHQGGDLDFSMYGLGLLLDSGTEREAVIKGAATYGHLGDAYGLKSGVYAFKNCSLAFAMNGAKFSYGEKAQLFSRCEQRIFAAVAKSLTQTNKSTWV